MSFADDNGITDATDFFTNKITWPEMINPYLREHYTGQKPRDGELWRNPMNFELVRYVDPEKTKDGVDNG